MSQFINAIKDITKTSSHKLSAVHNVVPEFDPLSKSQTILNWLTKVEECAEIYGWDERETIHYALPKLTGLAKTWYQSLPSVRFTWSEWKTKLVESFPCRENFADLLTEMLSLRARYGEPLENYYYAKLNLLNRCQISGKRAVDCILHGIEDRAIKLGAQAVQFESPEQVLKYFKSVKVAPSSKDSYHAKSKIDKRPSYNTAGSSQKTLSTSTSKGPIKCFNCNAEGHPSFLCPKPLLKCSNCRRIGHTVISCPYLRPERKTYEDKREDNKNEKTVLKIALNDVPISSSDTKDKYMMTIHVNNSPLSCFVDLGSECSLIRETDARSLGLIFMTDKLPLLKGVGPALVSALARVKVVADVQDISLDIDMYVVDDDILKHSVLLGHSFTEHPSLIITKTPSQLIFETIQTSEKLLMLVAKDILIKQKELRSVPVTSESSFTGSIYVNGSIRGKPGYEFYLLPGEYDLSNGDGCLLVQNISANDITFTKNALMTRANRPSDTKHIRKLQVNEVDFDDTLNIGDTLSSQQEQVLIDLLKEYADCFSNNLKDLGFTNETEMVIKLKDSEPVVYRPYRMSYAERAQVRDMVQEMLEAEIVRESSSPYASPIVLVKKKTGEKRLCVDFRALNMKTIKDHYPIPRVEDQLDSLSGNTLFTTLDLASGYYQIPIAEESTQLTAFVTPDGQYEYLRMPFGLVNAPSVFQRTINKILASAKVKFAIVYMDDILIPSKDVDQGVSRLKEVLDLLRKGGLTLKLSKCNFFFDKIDFLGFEVSGNGIRPGSRKTEAVSKFPVPKTQHEIRQFIGLASFFRRFVKDFAVIARPLTDLLRKNSVWTWTDEHDNAFSTLKKALTERPVLALYNPSAQTELHTDASKNGLAGILLQKGTDEKLHAVSYYSRKTTDDEKKLHSFELETLAVVASLNRFRVYLIGIPFKIYTDCNALRSTLTKRDLIPRIARWWIQMQEFDFSVEYRPGSQMSHVDALSRNPVESLAQDSHVLDVLSVDKDNWLSTVQMADEEIKSIKDVLSNPDIGKHTDIYKNYCLKNGRVYRKVDDSLKWLVPKGVRWQILRMNHDDVGHFGFDKTFSRIRESYWFPKMRRFIKKYVNACLECAHHKAQGGPKTGELHPIPKLEIPFHTIHADHLGPFVRSKRGNSYLLVIVDGFTKFANITAVRNTQSNTTIRVLRDHISYFGTPTRLITDRGSCFTSHTFKDFTKSIGVKHILNAVATPRANGQVERFNRTILDALSTKTHGKDDRTWDEQIPDIQLGLNTSVHSTTKKSPCELLFGYKVSGTSEGIMSEVIKDTTEVLSPEKLNELRQSSGNLIKAQQEKDKIRFNKKRKPSHVFSEGDLVRVEREISHNDGKSKKLVAKFQGPYRITKILPNDRFVVKDTPLTRKNNRGYEAVVAGDKLRPWLNFDTNFESSSDENDESIDN